MLTRAEAEGRNSPNVSSLSSPKKSSSSLLPKKSLLSSLLSGDDFSWSPTPIFSLRIWSWRTFTPRSKDKSCFVKLEELGLGLGLGLGRWIGPEDEEEGVEDANNDDKMTNSDLLDEKCFILASFF